MTPQNLFYSHSLLVEQRQGLSSEKEGENQKQANKLKKKKTAANL